MKSMNDPINETDYNIIKKAILRRNGMVYAAAFEICHPTATDEALEDLAEEIDSVGIWQENETFEDHLSTTIY